VQLGTLVFRRFLWAIVLIHAIAGLASAHEVVTTAAASSSPRRLHVHLVFDGPPLPSKLEDAAMQEVTGIWAAYGVDVHRSTATETGGDSAVTLAVRLADHPGRRMAIWALGSIPFRGGVPEPAIVMYPNTVAALVSTITLHGSSDQQWPVDFRNLILGRVFGRALAHEIGHFLLRSRDHAAVGLMRALQSAADLVAPERQRFVLSAREVARLGITVSAAVQAPPSTDQTGNTTSG
jgi:hypothetical protein